MLSKLFVASLSLAANAVGARASGAVHDLPGELLLQFPCLRMNVHAVPGRMVTLDLQASTTTEFVCGINTKHCCCNS